MDVMGLFAQYPISGNLAEVYFVYFPYLPYSVVSLPYVIYVLTSALINSQILRCVPAAVEDGYTTAALRWVSPR